MLQLGDRVTTINGTDLKKKKIRHKQAITLINTNNEVRRGIGTCCLQYGPGSTGISTDAMRVCLRVCLRAHKKRMLRSAS